MSERPEERLVELLERSGPEGGTHGTFKVWDYDEKQGVDLLPIARAMAEGIRALRKVADEAPMDSWVAIEASAALYALDSLGDEG